MKKFIDFCVRYKVWLLVATLFSSNGIQAYFNSIGINIPENIVEVKSEKKPITIKVIAVNCDGTVKEHVIEHHGGR